ncbi:MAG TPA: precorrin-6y C5,15-methyltransferase (decarboxylating) subunit CbiE [Rhizobiaceae bacterium]|nr:precorrin-6y C5,15-methyltransferase (decarboxylating) subunit CbiE [Rhizobiaceae bacterium]
MSAEPHPAPAQRWLSIVGIGEDGVLGLGDEAKRLISQAEFVFGGKRHLALAKELIRGEALAWPSPFDAEMKALKKLAGRTVCVLASGDPFLHGVGATVARTIPAAEFVTLPAPSAFSLVASRLGWALQEVDTVSLHGKQIDLIRPLLHPGRRVIALTSDEHGPGEIASLLVSVGFGASEITVLEALGGKDERMTRHRTDEFASGAVSPLNVVAIDVKAASDARVLALTPGLADELFEHDGQITKREIRALTLSALAPRRGELLWDIGAGSGSISIEWMLADPSMRAIAIEVDPERAARVARNAKQFGVPSLQIVTGSAPGALAGLPQPDVIFVGGGGSETGVLDAAISALKSGGRLVANAVTLEMETILIERHARLGGDLVKLAVSRVAPIGSMSGWKPALPITQWSWRKP